MIVAIELDERAQSAISEIESITELGRSAILSNALSLFLWAARQRRDHRLIASMDASQHSFRELDIPALKQVAGNKDTKTENVIAA